MTRAWQAWERFWFEPRSVAPLVLIRIAFGILVFLWALSVLPDAKTFFPRTLDFVRRLPFQQIGRCNVMGLDANDHGTVHRDGVPEEKLEVDHFITFVPGANKRLFLWDEEAKTKTPVTARAYWFNDSDYHGVEADPFFRYSIRVDGIFRDEFLRAVQDWARA